MTEPSKAQTIDGELPRHCAFTLPGVVLALGRDNWHCLKETYDDLSTDMQVRESLFGISRNSFIVLLFFVFFRTILIIFRIKKKYQNKKITFY